MRQPNWYDGFLLGLRRHLLLAGLDFSVDYLRTWFWPTYRERLEAGDCDADL